MKHLQCPKCGNSEVFYTKERYKGTCNLYFRTDGEDADNTDLYANAEHSYISKFIYCAECNARVRKINEVRENERIKNIF